MNSTPSRNQDTSASSGGLDVSSSAARCVSASPFVHSNASNKASRVGKMAKKCGQPDVGPAGDISHGRVGTMLADDVARDRKEMVVVFSGVGSHGLFDNRISDPYSAFGIWISDPIIHLITSRQKEKSDDVQSRQKEKSWESLREKLRS